MFIFQTLLRLLAALIIVGAIGIGVLGRERMLEIAFGPVVFSPIDFQVLTRTERPNQYLVCPPELCTAKTDVTSPVYPAAATQLRDTWLALMADQPRVNQIGESPDNMQYDFVQRSKLIRFPDTITVRFIPLPDDQSTLAIYSRSHYGYSDWGVNQQRIDTWLDMIRRRLTSKS